MTHPSETAISGSLTVKFRCVFLFFVTLMAMILLGYSSRGNICAQSLKRSGYVVTSVYASHLTRSHYRVEECSDIRTLLASEMDIVFTSNG